MLGEGANLGDENLDHRLERHLGGEVKRGRTVGAHLVEVRAMLNQPQRNVRLPCGGLVQRTRRVKETVGGGRPGSRTPDPI